jgi:hypothetical protein
MKTPVEFLKWNVIIGKKEEDIIKDINNGFIDNLPVIVDKEEIDSVECIQQIETDLFPINKINFKNGTFIYVGWNWATIYNKIF